MHILVTGGAGFIGRNFIKYLLNTYSDVVVICIDSLTYAGNMSTLDTVLNNPRFHFVKGSISCAHTVDSLLSQYAINAVVNFAAETHVDRSIESPDLFLKTSVLGVQTLMDACLKYNVKRFHQISTDEVYGDASLADSSFKFTELSPLKASNPYSASKAAADLLVQSYVRTYGLEASVSRCSNNYGPYQYPDKLIPLMTIKALNDEPLPLYGNGQNVRDWLYVEDHCSAIDAILQSDSTGEIYNIGGSCEKTNLEVVKTILAALNKSDALIEFVRDRPGHDLRYAVDSSKIKERLNWKPKYDFSTCGIVKTIEWYVANEKWWAPLMKGHRRYGIK